MNEAVVGWLVIIEPGNYHPPTHRFTQSICILVALGFTSFSTSLVNCARVNGLRVT